MAMQGAARLTTTDVLRFIAPLDAAIEAARQAKATKQNWQAVFNAINLIEALVEMKVARDEGGAIDALQQAVISALDRLKETGSKTLKAQEISALMDLLGLYSELLAGITHSELFDAQEKVSRRIIRVLAQGPNGKDVLLKVTGENYERQDH
jgi:hypothetical protein